MDFVECPHCGKRYKKRSLKIHIWRSHTERGRNIKFGGWNKGLTKETSEKVKNNSEKIKNTFNNRDVWNKGLTKETDERVKNISLKLNGKIRNNDFIPKNASFRGKHGWYNGYWCDSSWELAFVIYNLEYDIKFQRNTQKFEYEFEGKKYNYYPDFIMEDGTYIEIKGYETEKDKAKYIYFPYKLKVLKRKDIKYILDYVNKKYSKDFVTLYNDSKYPQTRTRKEYFEDVKNKTYEKEKNNIEKIINSDIDFSKFGWVNEVSKLINKKPQKIKAFMKKYLLEFYNDKCFKRK